MEWCQQWYATARYEEPLNALFTLPLVAQFLNGHGLEEDAIARCFKMEFKGGGKLSHNVPNCLWRGSGSVCIGKRFREHQMCCDFCLLPPLPAAVAEVKLAIPKTANSIFENFRADLEKCEEWLRPDTAPFVRKRFGVDGFDYALAILIDLSGTGQCRHQWEAGIDEDAYRRRGIFARLIAPDAP